MEKGEAALFGGQVSVRGHAVNAAQPPRHTAFRRQPARAGCKQQQAGRARQQQDEDFGRERHQKESLISRCISAIPVSWRHSAITASRRPSGVSRKKWVERGLAGKELGK